MNDKKINIFKWILYLIYIISIGYFGLQKNFAGIGMSVFCLVSAMILSKVYSKKIELIDTSLYIVANLFILFSILLGSSYEFYDKIKFYDDFLHFWSGFVGVKIAWNLTRELNVDYNDNKLIFFIVLLLVSMGISAMCEVSEYTLDTVFNMKTQAGGLVDTMHDMIDALAGSLLMMIYYFKKIGNNTKNIL